MTSSPEVHKIASTVKPKMEGMCFRCGKPGHYASKCRVSKAVTCHQCGKAGHLRACKSGYKASGEEQRVQPGAVCSVVDEAEEKESELPILHVRACKKTPPYLVTVEADGVDLQMEVDMGSSVSLVSRVTFRKLWLERKLSQCKYRLQSYAEESITVLGCVEVEVQYKGQVTRLPLIMVEGSGPTLLGRSWLKHIVLDWQEVRRLAASSLQEVLDHYPEVFRDGLGMLKNFEAKIHVNPDVTPRFCKARSVPYAMREKVEEELKRLVGEGTLEPVQVTDWAAPIVPVLKAD